MKTNNLIHTVSKNNNKVNILVKIRLSDECKNGHQDFAITATYWEIGKERTDRNMLGGGCCHDEILKHFPEFKIFVNLHSCDFEGSPMYPSANGLYHLENGFNNTPAKSPNFKKEFCNYYRIEEQHFKTLKKAENETEYAILLDELGILKSWKKEANKAIKILEELTGNEFLNDSTRVQHTPPSIEEVELFKQRKLAGYYTDERKRERAEAKRKEQKEKRIKDLKEEAKNKIQNIDFELKLSIKLLNFDIPTNNWIFYKHTKNLCFNWNTTSYNKEINETTLLKACRKLKKFLSENNVIVTNNKKELKY